MTENPPRRWSDWLKLPQVRITIIYVVFGCAWIYFSDGLMFLVLQSPEAITTAQNYKGWFFIAFTAAILYVLVKKSFESQETQHQQLQDIFEATNTATWEWNVQTGQTRFSERWASIIGYRLEELEPVDISTWIDNCHPDDLAGSEERLKAHFAGETDFYSHEARMRHKDGHWVWVLDRGRVVEWDAEGNPVWMYGTHQDISEKKHAELSLERALVRLQKLTDQVPGVIYQYQQWPDGRAAFPFASGGLFRIDGVQPELIEQEVSDVLNLLHPEDVGSVVQSIRESFLNLTLWNCEFRARPDGKHTIWLEGTAQPERQDDGSVLWHGYIRDVTKRRASDAKLREAANVFKYANDGIFITRLDGTIVDVNDAFCQITGYSRSEVVGENPRILKSGRHSAAYYIAMFKALAEEGKWSSEVWNRRKDGQEFVSRQTVSVIYNEKGQPDRYLSLFSDVTELKQTSDKLRHLAQRDPLTGLPNRSELTHRLAQSITKALQAVSSLAVAYIDLDGFKVINDQRGHPTGDRVLKLVGERLATSFRDSDVIGRIGGDEFVAIVEHVPPGHGMDRIMERVLADMREPFRVDEQTFQLSASIGVAWLPLEEELDGDQLIRQADQAMYQAKQAGRDRYRSFDLDLDHQVRQAYSIVAEVKSALASEEFVLFYQPKVNMETGEVVGAEALIRWAHPDKGLLTPNHFLPHIAAQTVMEDLSFWVLNQAAKQVCEWKQADCCLPVSVNIDGYTLLQPGFVPGVKAVLERHSGLEPGDLEIEVLETSAIQDIERVQSVMAECADFGLRFSIDDFGTGYSSLTYLKNLPAPVLKIDTSFVRDMLEDPDDLSILYGILGLAKSFGRQCIAEGVETIDHGLLLLACGCHFGQGYAIARPMPAEDVLDWASTWEPSALWKNHGEPRDGSTRALFAFVEHNAWMLQLKRFLSDPSCPRPALDETRCSLGSWIAKCSGDRELGQPIPDSLLEVHRRLHYRASALVAQTEDPSAATPQYSVDSIDQLHCKLVAELEAYLGIKLQSAG